MDQHELEAHLEGRFSGEEVQTPVEEEPSTEPAAEVVDTSEEPAEAQQEGTTEEDQVQKYLAKYGGDTQKALEAAVERESFMGRQSGEIGELRKELQEFKTLLEPEEAEQYPVTNELTEWAQEQAYSNPVQAAYWALQNQPALYENIVSAWAEYDPINATRFDTDRRMEAYRAQMQNEIAPVIAPVVATTNRDKFLQAYSHVKETVAPDLDQFAPALLDLAKESPETIAVLENGDPETRERVLTSLYWMARGRAAAGLGEVAQAAVQSAEQQAKALRAAAAVGTQTSGHPAPAPAQNEGLDAFRQAFLEEAVGIGALKPEALND